MGKTGIEQWRMISSTSFFQQLYKRSIIKGQLANSSTGENLLVNSSPGSVDDGIITVDVKNVISAQADASTIVRYQNATNYYLVHPYNNRLSIFERLNGTYYEQVWVTIPTIVPGQVNKLLVTVEGPTISVNCLPAVFLGGEWTVQHLLDGHVSMA